MAKKTYIIKDKGKGQLDTVDPNSLISISEQTASNAIQSIVPGDNISVDNTDPQNPVVSSTGTTPTLSEVLAEGNNAGDEVIQFEYDDGPTYELGFMDIPTGMGTQKELSFGTPSFRVTPFGFFSDFMGHKLNFTSATEQGGGGGDFNSYYIDSNDGLTRGLVGSSYFGANYNDNTYVQKKYVDDTINAIPTPSLTLEQARQNGNVFEGNVEFTDDIKLYSGDVIGETDLNLISYEDHFVNGRGITILSTKDDNSAYITTASAFGVSMTASTLSQSYSVYLNNDGKGLQGLEEFDKQGDRKAFAQIADVEDFYTTITGYDVGETQTLKHVNGVLQWITD